MHPTHPRFGGFNFRDGIRKAGNETSAFLAEHLGSTFNSAQERAITVSMGPLALAASSVALLIYKQGEESVKPYGNKTYWKKILAESLLGYFIAENTKGIFPLYGVALGAYKAGQKPNALEKIQSAVQTACTLALGWLGVIGTSSVTEGFVQREEATMAKCLEDPALHPWQTRLKLSDDPQTRRFGYRLDDLKNKIGTRQWHYRQPLGTQDWPAIKALKKEIAGLKTTLADNFYELGENIVPKGAKAQTPFNILRNTLLESEQTYIKLTRFLNPMFGYAIFGLVLGAPVAKLINAQIEKLWPQLKQKKLPSPFSGTSTLPTLKGHASNQPTLLMPGIGTGVLH